MPDTFTHFALPAIFRRYFHHRLFPAAVLLGAVLPDYLREIIFLALPAHLRPAAFFTHSLAGILFISLFIALFFIAEQRLAVFSSLFSGQLLHMVMDTLQGHLDGGRMYWLLPWWKSFEFPLFSESHWIYIFAGSLTFFIIFSIFDWRKNRG